MEPTNNNEYLMNGNGEKQDRQPPPEPPKQDKNEDYSRDSPSQESADIPDLIEPEIDWDRE